MMETHPNTKTNERKERDGFPSGKEKLVRQTVARMGKNRRKNKHRKTGVGGTSEGHSARRNLGVRRET